MGGLGLGVLGAGYVRHTRDGTQRGTRGWCKSRGLEVIRRNVRGEGKSRGRQGGELGARGRIVTVREVRDYSNAVPGIRGFVTRRVNGWGGMRKSRGRVRM
jgi:hypothetical protein